MYANYPGFAIPMSFVHVAQAITIMRDVLPVMRNVLPVAMLSVNLFCGFVKWREWELPWPLQFYSDRIQNPTEHMAMTLVAVGLKTAVVAISGPVTPVYGYIFDDIGNLAVVAYLAVSQVDQSSLNITYGVGNIVSATIRPVCKAALHISKFASLATAGVVCESIGGIFIIAERDVQTSNTTFEHVVSTPSTYLRAVGQGFARSVSRDFMDGVFKDSPHTQMMQRAASVFVSHEGHPFVHTFIVGMADGWTRSYVQTAFSKTGRDVGDEASKLAIWCCGVISNATIGDAEDL